MHNRFNIRSAAFAAAVAVISATASSWLFSSVPADGLEGLNAPNATTSSAALTRQGDVDAPASIKNAIVAKLGLATVSLQRRGDNPNVYAGVASSAAGNSFGIEVSCRGDAIIGYRVGVIETGATPKPAESNVWQSGERQRQVFDVESLKSNKTEVEHAIDQLSQWSGIPARRIREMHESERSRLLHRYISSKTGMSVAQVAESSDSERFDALLRSLAAKYRITVSQARRLADIQQKLDSGAELSREELDFLRQTASLISQ